MDGYKIRIAAVVGPTASGKTGLAVGLAKLFDGEVVSADSMQIYKGMDISTAKPTASEKCGIAHFMMDFLPVEASFSVADYCSEAKKHIVDISSRKKLPILCGGTGLYVSSLLDNLDFGGSGANETLRAEIRARAESLGGEALLRELAEVDSETAASLHPNNIGRIVRALELFYSSGITMSEQRRLSRKNPSPYEPCIIFLDARDRQYLYDRINIRVDKMMDCGLLDEAKEFYKRLSSDEHTAAQAIGCKEFVPYFKGEISLDEAVEKIKRETRRYAKRQLTWFNRIPDTHKLFIDEFDGDGLLSAAADIIKSTFD